MNILPTTCTHAPTQLVQQTPHAAAELLHALGGASHNVSDMIMMGDCSTGGFSIICPTGGLSRTALDDTHTSLVHKDYV